MIPDETVVRDFVCTGQVMPDTVSSVPPYLDPAQVGHIVNAAREMDYMGLPDWLVLAFPFILAFSLAFVIWLVEDAGCVFTRLKWWWRDRAAAKRRERACQTCTERGMRDSQGL